MSISPVIAPTLLLLRCARHRARLERGFSRGGNCAADEAAAEHPRLARRRVVENASLAWRYAHLAVDEIDLDAVGAPAQPCRLRRPRGAHLDEDLVPAHAQRMID